jgi:hypothetical protein
LLKPEADPVIAGLDPAWPARDAAPGWQRGSGADRRIRHPLMKQIAEIAFASAEQSTGIDQINTALTQMDEVTQQNSALVEDNAASAKSLEVQSAGMDERVSFFKLGDSAPAGAPPRVVALARKRHAAAAPKAGSRRSKRRIGRPHAGRARRRGEKGGLEGVRSLRFHSDIDVLVSETADCACSAIRLRLSAERGAHGRLN